MMTFQMIFRIISKYSGDIHVKHKIKKTEIGLCWYVWDVIGDSLYGTALTSQNIHYSLDDFIMLFV